MKTPEDLDMTALVETTIQSIHASQGSPGGDLSPIQKNLMASALMPIIWHASQAVLAQLNAAELKASAAGDEESLAAFSIPDSLEGLEGFDGPAHA